MGTGTGKTYTSLELIKNFKTDNLLVISPHNAIKQWQNELKTYYPKYNVIELPKSWSSVKINDYLKKYEFKGCNAFVINYDMVFRLPELLRIVDNTWTIILDEMHRIRNYGTIRKPNKTVSFILKLGELTENKVGLTATPVQGHFGGYLEYYTQLKFLGYIDMSYQEFYNHYVIYREVAVGGVPFPIKKITGYRDTGTIDELLQLIARRYVPSYEDYEPVHITIKLDRTRTYARTVRENAYKDIVLNSGARKRIAKKTLTTGTIHGHTMLGDFMSYVDNTIKIDWLKDFLEDVDAPVIVMYNYNVELNTLVQMAERLKIPYEIINGSVSDKNAVVNRDWKVLFGQYQAMSEALDGLQFVTNIMVLFAMPESSLLYRQVIGRIDRIGQTKPPTYYSLIMENTIDSVIQENIENKIEFSEKTLNLLEV